MTKVMFGTLAVGDEFMLSPAGNIWIKIAAEQKQLSVAGPKILNGKAKIDPNTKVGLDDAQLVFIQE